MDPNPIADQSPMLTDPPLANHTQPSYTQMIIGAISGLKDKDGSSRQAISKYIEKQFPILPSNHDVMLTQHLKSLKNQGQVVMFKHSYMLPPVPVSGVPYSTQLDFSNPSSSNVSHANGVSGVTSVGSVEINKWGLEKRKPGRPPKLRPVVPALGLGVQSPAPPGFGLAAQSPTPLPKVQVYNDSEVNVNQSHQFPYNASDGQGQGKGPVQGQGVGVNNGSGVASENLYALLGLGDDGFAVAEAPVVEKKESTTVVAKRGRGRPPKNGGSGGRVVSFSSPVAAIVDGGLGGHVVDSSAAVGAIVVAGDNGGAEVKGDAGGEVQGAVKRGRGRPGRKGKMMSGMGGNGMRVKSGRGRPKRIGMGAVTVPLSGNVSRPRGRPKRMGRPNVVVNGESVLGKRRPGRPSVNKIINKIAKSTGQQFGRPSKDGPGTAIIVTDPRDLVVYQELKSKYELLQSKVKQVASVLKSGIDPNYGNTALEVLQELEALAGGDATAPSHGQIQEPTLISQN